MRILLRGTDLTQVFAPPQLEAALPPKADIEPHGGECPFCATRRHPENDIKALIRKLTWLWMCHSALPFKTANWPGRDNMGMV
jgi:hypothetical protein